MEVFKFAGGMMLLVCLVAIIIFAENADPRLVRGTAQKELASLLKVPTSSVRLQCNRVGDNWACKGFSTHNPGMTMEVGCSAFFGNVGCKQD